MLFKIPHILRCSRNDDGCFPNDGFDVVYCGGVKVGEISLEIFEWDNLDAPRPVWEIPYEKILRVDANLFRSEGGNFRGGMVRFIGTFDRYIEERVTMQMTLDVYNDFVEAFKSRCS